MLLVAINVCSFCGDLVQYAQKFLLLHGLKISTFFRQNIKVQALSFTNRYLGEEFLMPGGRFIPPKNLSPYA